jgi:thymidylate synthase
VQVLVVDGVEDAYRRGLELVYNTGLLEHSRVGDVLAVPGPVATVYTNPRERVLFNERRDANPFFHLIESVWMLSGTNDATFLDRYVKNFSERFAEDDGLAHGAYGHRWRNHFVSDNLSSTIDQLVEAGKMLFENPTTRRVVIAMWDPTVDLAADMKDVPCNLSIMCRSRMGPTGHWVLDTTVCCRSNDAIWGAYGANAVHMSVVSEVLAGLAGMELGTYTQFSNNLHAYTDILKKVWDGAAPKEPNPYQAEIVRPLSILENKLSWGKTRSQVAEEARRVLEDAELFYERVGNGETLDARDYSTHWFQEVVVPMEQVHMAVRAGGLLYALQLCILIEASDWRLAAQQWLKRRIAKKAQIQETRDA